MVVQKKPSGSEVRIFLQIESAAKAEVGARRNRNGSHPGYERAGALPQLSLSASADSDDCRQLPTPRLTLVTWCDTACAVTLQCLLCSALKSSGISVSACLLRLGVQRLLHGIISGGYRYAPIFCFSALNIGPSAAPSYSAWFFKLWSQEMGMRLLGPT